MKKILLLLFLSSPSWASFCGGYTYQRTLTTNPVQVGTGTLNYFNFPALFSVNDVTFSTTTSAGGHLSTGYDLIISSDSACQYQVAWDTETVQNVGVSTFNAHIAIDFSSATARTYYVTYGNPAITTYQGISTNTWNNGLFKWVSHLRNGTTLSVADATGANSPTNSGATATTGIIDGAAALDATHAQFFSTVNTAALTIERTDPFTLEFWFNIPTTASTMDLFCNLNSGSRGIELALGGHIPLLFMQNSGANSLEVDFQKTIDDGTWHHFAVTYSGNSLTSGVRGYLDGVLLQKVVVEGLSATITTTQALTVGIRGFSSTIPLTGSIDEFRLYKGTAATAGWVVSDYNSQKTGSTFFTLGPETTSAVIYSPLIRGLSIQGTKVRVSSTTMVIQ